MEQWRKGSGARILGKPVLPGGWGWCLCRLMLSLCPSHHRHVSEDFGRQGCHACHPLRLPSVSQCVRPANLLHGGQLQGPFPAGTRRSSRADGVGLSPRMAWLVKLLAPPQAPPPAAVRPAPVQSVLLISERNTLHSVGILSFLERAGAQLPPLLLSFVQAVLATREEQKRDRPLCSHLKATGVCRSLIQAYWCQFGWFAVPTVCRGSGVDSRPGGSCSL